MSELSEQERHVVLAALESLGDQIRRHTAGTAESAIEVAEMRNAILDAIRRDIDNGDRTNAIAAHARQRSLMMTFLAAVDREPWVARGEGPRVSMQWNGDGYGPRDRFPG